MEFTLYSHTKVKKQMRRRVKWGSEASELKLDVTHPV